MVVRSASPAATVGLLASSSTEAGSDGKISARFAGLVEKTLAAARLVSDEVDRLLDDTADSSGVGSLTRRSLLAFVESVVDGLSSDAEEPSAVADEMERHALCWAAEGYSLLALIRLYGIAHRLSVHRAVVAIESDSRGAAWAQSRLAMAVGVGSQMHDAAIEALMSGFAQVQPRDRRAAGNWKLRLVRRLLTGDVVDETPLGYPLSGFHVGVVVEGPDAESAATVVQDAWLGRTLRVCADSQTLWLWLATPSLDRSVLPRCGLQLPPGNALALGDPAQGREGFIASHREALIALRLGPKVGRAVAYEQVALVALLAQDRLRARQFVTRELGPLDGDGAPAVRDRATLRAYLDSRLNAASAAARLGVHRNSLANRLRRVEALLGRAIESRSTELDVALRLRGLTDVLGDGKDNGHPLTAAPGA